MGSLRQAILDANAHVGADAIVFNVAGTIQLTSKALPSVSGQVLFDGTTAPGFTTRAAISVDFGRFAGLQFVSGSAGSKLRSMRLVNASGPGVTLNGVGSMVIAGDIIANNFGNGLELDASSSNTIGGIRPQDRNLFSANQNNGIFVNGSSNNQIRGNYIGTDMTGSLDRGNLGNGILVTGGASNVIGGASGNVISGNDANGVIINGGAKLTTVSGNTIGLSASGNTAIGNTLDGVSLQNTSFNVVGQSNPVSSITYNNTSQVPTQPVNAWQGIRGAATPGQYVIVGTSGSNGLLFQGTMAGVGTSQTVNVPGASTTSVYGPDVLDGGNLDLVGSYKNADYATAPVKVNGFLFQGSSADLSSPNNYVTVDHPGATFNYVHSVMGGLVVGNYDQLAQHGQNSVPLGPGHAYIYSIALNGFITDIVYPNSTSDSAYGIWYNGGTSYTICGGYSNDTVNNFNDQNQPIGKGFLVDYNSATGLFSNWTSYSYPAGTSYVTHFESISSVEKGVYTLSADSAQTGAGNLVQGSFVTVSRNADGSFGTGAWVNLNYPRDGGGAYTVSSNSVYGNQVVGLTVGADSFSYQATVNIGFQLSNVISGNGGNGIGLYGASNNQIAMNYIGTDAGGTVDLGNANNGILVTAGSTNNLIGGTATGGNDPTNNPPVLVRPPQGNLISGNNGNGVLITGAATANTLSGNFIGTAASGDSALGNTLDGVAIVNADGNALSGCTIRTNPFVYYNVIDGNGGNGLRVTSSNNTTIQANFFGINADNDSAIGNRLNGVLVEGTSANTVMGGPIPLGNVVAANGQNGIVVRDTASAFTSYNTFCGLAAFSDNANFGNGHDGMLITSTGSNILIRTNVVTRNGYDGIEVGGSAQGVRIVGNIVGLNTSGTIAMGNVHDGVEVDGNASNIVIGGPQPTFNIIPYNVISANSANGVEVGGTAHNIQINSSDIGTDFSGVHAQGNGHEGVLLNTGSYATTVGSLDPSLLTVISGNADNGVEMIGTHGNTVVGCLIGTNSVGAMPLKNGGNGVYISNSSDNIVGRPSGFTNGTAGGPANIIAFNGLDGVDVASGNRNAIQRNAIYFNELAGIELGALANAHQAAPVLISARVLPLGTQVSGTVTGTPNMAYTIEFFASDTASTSGRYFLGLQKVTANAAGVATFNFYGLLPPIGANFVTATATDANNDTSAFSSSAWVPV